MGPSAEDSRLPGPPGDSILDNAAEEPAESGRENSTTEFFDDIENTEKSVSKDSSSLAAREFLSHRQRSSFHAMGSYDSSVSLLMSSTFGTGVLAVPFAFSSCGIVVGILVVAAASIFSSLSNVYLGILARTFTARGVRVDSYGKLLSVLLKQQTFRGSEKNMRRYEPSTSVLTAPLLEKDRNKKMTRSDRLSLSSKDSRSNRDSQTEALEVVRLNSEDKSSLLIKAVLGFVEFNNMTYQALAVTSCFMFLADFVLSLQTAALGFVFVQRTHSIVAIAAVVLPLCLVERIQELKILSRFVVWSLAFVIGVVLLRALWQLYNYYNDNVGATFDFQTWGWGPSVVSSLSAQHSSTGSHGGSPLKSGPPEPGLPGDTRSKEYPQTTGTNGLYELPFFPATVAIFLQSFALLVVAVPIACELARPFETIQPLQLCAPAAAKFRRIALLPIEATSKVAFLYCAVALAVAFQFGRDTKADFLQNYGPHELSIVPCRLILCCVLIITCVVNLFPVCQALWQLLGVNNDSDYSSEDRHHHNYSTKRAATTRPKRNVYLFDYCLKPLLAALAVGVSALPAIFFTDVGAFIGTISSIFATTSGLLLPGLMAWLGGRLGLGSELPFPRAGPAVLVVVTLVMWTNIALEFWRAAGAAT